MTDPTRRWLFADQLGPHFLDRARPAGAAGRVQGGVPAARRSTGRRRTWCCPRCATAPPSWAIRPTSSGPRRTARRVAASRSSVCHPTSRARPRPRPAAAAWQMLPPRGFVTAPRDFVAWAERPARPADGGLLPGRPAPARHPDGRRRAGRRPVEPRRTTTASRRPRTATLDVAARRRPIRRTRSTRGVRADLDRWERDDGIEFVGRTGRGCSRPPGTRRWPGCDISSPHRLPAFGPYEDAMLAGDPLMAHSLLSAPAEPGPARPARGGPTRPSRRTGPGARRWPSVEGFVRQIIGWRDYVWHLYWYFEPGYRGVERAAAPRPSCPKWFADLDADAVEAALPVRRAGRGPRPRPGCTTSRG